MTMLAYLPPFCRYIGRCSCMVCLWSRRVCIEHTARSHSGQGWPTCDRSTGCRRARRWSRLESPSFCTTQTSSQNPVWNQRWQLVTI